MGLARETRLTRYPYVLMALLGVLRKAQGAWEDANRCFSEAASLASEGRSMLCPYAEASLLYEYGMLHVRQSQPEEAQERFHSALDIFYQLGAQKDVECTEQALPDLHQAP